jgi:hypothetical protein
MKKKTFSTVLCNYKIPLAGEFGGVVAYWKTELYSARARDFCSVISNFQGM